MRLASVVTAEDIERELAEDLDDLVRFQPGVSMATASRGGNEGFAIRGIGGNRVLTVVDGIRSNDIYHAGPSSYGRDNFDTDNIKAVWRRCHWRGGHRHQQGTRRLPSKGSGCLQRSSVRWRCG